MSERKDADHAVDVFTGLDDFHQRYVFKCIVATVFKQMKEEGFSEEQMRNSAIIMMKDINEQCVKYGGRVAS